MLASTVKFRPRNLLIVRALAGDSTITSDLPEPPADFFFVMLKPGELPRGASVKMELLRGLGYLLKIVTKYRREAPKF